DLYSWGIHDDNDVAGAEDGMDIRDVGVQALPGDALGGTAADRSLVFLINTYGRASNQGVNEFDIAIDLQSDGRPDYFVVGTDIGRVLANEFDGRFGSFIFDAAGNLIDVYAADAPMNGSVIELPTLASEIGLDPNVNSTKFNYTVASFSLVPGDFVDTTTAGSFRSHQPPVSSGDFKTLAPAGSHSLTLSDANGQAAVDPVLGLLVASL